MKVLVLHDDVPEGAPPDQVDALVQAELVREVLAGDGHEVVIRPFTSDVAALAALTPDLVFNLAESVGGDGRLAHLVPAVLETLGVPFTGSGAAAIAVTSDKVLTKAVLGAAGFAVPAAWPAGGPRSIVKSRFEEASVGIDDDNIVTADQVEAAMKRLAPRLGGSVITETYVDGRELNVSVLDGPEGPRALPVAEIAFDLPPGRERIVGYAAKWASGSAEERGTPRTFDVRDLDVQAVAAKSVEAFRTLGLRGYARVDWRVGHDGTPVVLEVNANPCLSPDAGFVAACVHAGLTARDAVRAICLRALEDR